MKHRFLIGCAFLFICGGAHASAGVMYLLGGGTILGALGWLLLFGGFAIVSELVARWFDSKKDDYKK